MIAEINSAWNWKGFVAIEVVRTNDFGNVIFKTDKNDFWRICPEELSCKKIANNEVELKRILADPDFILDWRMSRLVTIAKSKLGELRKGQKFSLKLPGILGGEYNENNLAMIEFSELISFSGDLGFQIKDLKEGDKFEIKIKN